MERLAICKNYIDDRVKLSTYTCSEHLYGRVEQVCIKFRGLKNPISKHWYRTGTAC
jgi:hypothetical protein